jgi:MFS family permease
MPLLAWGWRDRLGRRGALVLALLLAVDPWLTALSRSGDGAILAWLLGLALVTALHRLRQAPARAPGGWRILALAAAGLLPAAGPPAWSVLLLAMLFAWLTRHRDERPLPFERRDGLVLLFWLGLGATGLALRPEAIAAVSESLNRWVAGFSGAALFPLGWPWLRLLVDQPLLAIFGGGVLVTTSVQALLGRPDRRFLLLWLLFAAGVIFLLLPGRSPQMLPALALPLMAAVALTVEWLLERPAVFAAEGGLAGRERIIALGVQAVLLVVFAIWVAITGECRSVTESACSGSHFWVGPSILVLAALGWAILGYYYGFGAAGQQAGLFYGAMLFLMTVRSSGQLNHRHDFMRPDGFWPAVAMEDLRLLAHDIEELGAQRRGDRFEMPIQVVTPLGPDPQIGWYLRNQRRLAWVRSPDTAGGVGGVAPLIIAMTPATGNELLAPGYIGADYKLRYEWLPGLLPVAPAAEDGIGATDDLRWREWLRPVLLWVLYREVSQPPATVAVTLWAERLSD